MKIEISWLLKKLANHVLGLLFWVITEYTGFCEDFYFFFVPSGYDESAYDGQQAADCGLVEFQQDRIADSEGDAVTEHDSAGNVE